MKTLAIIGKKKIDMLRSKSGPVGEITDDILSLAENLVVTCRKKGGHAIAAVQVGIPVNLVALDNGEAYINVTLDIDEDSGLNLGPEGCLSLPGRFFEVPRYNLVTVHATQLNGTDVSFDVDTFKARMWQHEYDHLLGILICDQGYKEIRHFEKYHESH